MRKLILITGYTNSGKDTVADFLFGNLIINKKIIRNN